MAKEVVSKAFICGFKRTANLQGSHKWPSMHDSAIMDANALREDWNYVGEAIYTSAKKIGKSEGISVKIKAAQR